MFHALMHLSCMIILSRKRDTAKESVRDYTLLMFYTHCFILQAGLHALKPVACNGLRRVAI